MRIFSFSNGQQTLDIPAESMAEAVTELPYHWKSGNEPIQLSVTIRPTESEVAYWKARCGLLENKLHAVLGGAYGQARK